MTPAPPSPFPTVNRVLVEAGTVLHRIHNHCYDPDGFNPCQGRLTRFAPLRRSDDSCISTAYAAESLECAVHETVFHEVEHTAARKTVDVEAVMAFDHSVVTTARDLTVCGLFEPDLNRWGLTRGNLIDTFASQYKRTAKWAIAIHDAHSDVDGLVWTSRRCDPALAYVLFGDRVGKAALQVSSRERVGGPLLAQMHEFGKRAGITLVL